MGAIVVLTALAGCGQSAPRHAHSAPVAKRDPEPFGRLSAAEYTAIVRQYTELKPLQRTNSVPQAVQRARGACTATGQPNTRLMTLVRKDCLNALVYFTALAAVEADPTRPQGYAQLSVAIHATVANAESIDAELHRRRIHGLCAQSIGITQAQVRSMNAAALAASEAGDAAGAGDSAGFLIAQHRLTQALATEPGGDPLVGIKRACPHGSVAPKATPRGTPRKQPHLRPKPRARPLPQPQLPSPGGGVKA